MSTCYYIVNEKIKENRKKEYENLLALVEQINDTVYYYCAKGKLSVDTLDDIKNSLGTWKWFVDKEDGYYRFLQTTATTYTFHRCEDEGRVYELYENITDIKQALYFIEHNDDYNVYDEYGERIEFERLKQIINSRLGVY